MTHGRKKCLGESIYGKNIINLEQFGTKSFSTVFISTALAEQHSKFIGKSNVAKIIFFNFKA